MSQAIVYLSRRNLLTLLSKLDRKAEGEVTECTIVKCRQPKDDAPFNQTMKELRVVAIEDDAYYGAQNRHSGEMHPKEEGVLATIKAQAALIADLERQIAALDSQVAELGRLSEQLRIDAARKRLEELWDSHGTCDSCGWHAALYEHNVSDADILEALTTDKGILHLSCKNKDDEDRYSHRGVKIFIGTE